MAPAVWLQHGDSRCSQCMSFRSALLVAPRGLSLAGACLHHMGRDSQKIRLVSAETNTGMYLLGCLGKVRICWYSTLGCGKVWKRGMLQAPCKLQALRGYSSILAAVENLHSSRVMSMGAEVPLAVFCAARAIPCPKNSAGSLSSRLEDQEEGCRPVVQPRGASMVDECQRS